MTGVTSENRGFPVSRNPGKIVFSEEEIKEVNIDLGIFFSHLNV